MDILLVNQQNVLACAVVTAKNLHIVLLQTPRLFSDTVVRIGDTVREKARPFAVRECIVVQLFELSAKIALQFILGVNLQVFISLRLEHTNKLRLQLRLGLIALGVLLNGSVFGYDCIFF